MHKVRVNKLKTQHKVRVKSAKIEHKVRVKLKTVQICNRQNNNLSLNFLTENQFCF